MPAPPPAPVDPSLLPAGARHPLIASSAALAIAVVTALLLAHLAGLHKVGRAFDDLRPAWIVLGAAAQLASVPAYVRAYRAVVEAVDGRRLTRRVTTQLVIVGFGPFVVSGGFSSDRRALQILGIDRRAALQAVLDLGGVEFITLVWIAFLAAAVALVRDPWLAGGLVWPWLLAVPVGTAVAVGLARLRRPEQVREGRMVAGALTAGLSDVLGFVRHPRQAASVWLGIFPYWFGDMLTLYAALRTFGLRPAPETVVLAYATGYLLSRRTLPLGGAGFVELLMTFSLYWVHEPFAPALAGVVLYRGFDFLLAALPALLARLRLRQGAGRARPFEPQEDGGTHPSES